MPVGWRREFTFMNDVPSGLWEAWIVISGLCFFLILIVAAVLLWVILKKVLPVLDDVQKKMQSLNDKVDGITTTAKSTVDTIHAKTTSILGHAEDASIDVAKRVGSASAAISMLIIGVKLYTAIKSMRTGDKSTEKK